MDPTTMWDPMTMGDVLSIVLALNVRFNTEPAAPSSYNQP